MIFEQRIWKMCAPAVVTTIVFTAFLFRVGEWTRGLRSEFVVYGQASSPTTPPSGTATVTKVIPQIAVGSFDNNVTKYKTVIQIVNEGTAASTISGNFYNNDGTASTLAFTTNLSTLPTVTGGFSSISLPASGILVITGETAASYVVNWGKIVSAGGTVSISAYFDLTNGAGAVLYSRVGVPASDANMARFTIPRVRNVNAGLDVGFALVNTGTSSAILTATLRSATGQVLASKDLTLGAGAHTATFAKDFFGLTGETGGTNYSFMAFESQSAQFAATALAIEGASLSSFPVSNPAAGGTASGGGTSVEVVDGSVTTAKLARAAVTSDKLAAGAVTTDKVADSAITEAKVAPGHVVKSINSLKDDVTLTAGANITITAAGVVSPLPHPVGPAQIPTSLPSLRGLRSEPAR